MRLIKIKNEKHLCNNCYYCDGRRCYQFGIKPPEIVKDCAGYKQRILYTINSDEKHKIKWIDCDIRHGKCEMCGKEGIVLYINPDYYQVEVCSDCLDDLSKELKKVIESETS